MAAPARAAPIDPQHDRPIRLVPVGGAYVSGRRSPAGRLTLHLPAVATAILILIRFRSVSIAALAGIAVLLRHHLPEGGALLVVQRAGRGWDVGVLVFGHPPVALGYLQSQPVIFRLKGRDPPARRGLQPGHHLTQFPVLYRQTPHAGGQSLTCGSPRFAGIVINKPMARLGVRIGCFGDLSPYCDI